MVTSIGRVWTVVLVVVGCHSGTPGNAQREPAPVARACDARLAELKRFYEAAAAELEASPSNMRLVEARPVAGLDALVTIDGKPADASRSDLLVIGTKAAVLVTLAGELEPLASRELDGISPTGTTRSLVIAIDGGARASAVSRVLAALAKPEDRYDPIAVAYRIAGAFAGRQPPAITGFGPGGVDIATAGDTIAHAAADHCPGVAKELAALRSGSTGPGAAMLRAVAAQILQCDCGVDPAPLEALPWLIRSQPIALVPLAATAPPLDPRGDATWADLVRAHGGKPIDVALPPRAPLPPPPPRPRPR